MKKDDFINLMESMHKEEKEEHLKKNADYADRNGLNILATLNGWRRILTSHPKWPSLFIWRSTWMQSGPTSGLDQSCQNLLKEGSKMLGSTCPC